MGRATPANAQGADQARRAAFAWAAAWGGALALAAWTRSLAVGWVWAAAGGALLWTVLACRRGARPELLASALLWVTVGIAVGVAVRLDRIAVRWPAVQAQVEERAAQALARDLRALVERGEAATDALAAATRETLPGVTDGRLFARAGRIRAETGSAAVAVYDARGDPLAWAGEHRGRVPAAVRRGEVPYLFVSGPLFNYLYFARRTGEGRTAIAATLLEGSISIGEGDPPFAAEFRDRVGILPRFTPPDRASGGAVWDWTAGGVPVLSASFAALTAEGWRARLVERGRRAVWGMGIALAVLLVALWFRRRAGPPFVPVLALTAAGLVLPLGDVPGLEALFSPLNFVLPVPRDGTLGELLVVLAGAAVWLLARPVPRRGGWGWWAARVASAAVILPLGFGVMRAAAAPSLLARHPAGGIPLVLALALLWALPLLALLGTGAVDASRRQSAVGAAAALLLAGTLGIALVTWWAPGREIPAWTPALWAAPFALLAVAPPWGRLGRGMLLPWLLVAFIAGSGALAHLWTLHQAARLAEADASLARLGAEPDPFLEFLLDQFSEEVLFHAAEGENGVNLLYRSWVTGGLAAEGYEARATLWEGDRAASELRLGGGGIPASQLAGLLAEARGAETPVVRRNPGGGLHYLLLVPLSGGRVVSVAVAPRRALGRSTALARFLDPARAGTRGIREPELTLISAGAAPANGAGPHWRRTGAGWRSESWIRFPEGSMHAHLLVHTPSGAILGARALLVQSLLLLICAKLWLAGQLIAGARFRAAEQFGAVRSFRGRLTLALFGFFLLPLLLLSATVYRALAREVVRTAGALAARATEQAATEVDGSSLTTLAAQVDSDLLLYRQGTLQAAAAPEVLQLGLYPSWLPPNVYLAFRSGEATAEQVERRLGGNPYLIAYRRLPAGAALASPIPLAAGEIARRRRELADAVGLAALLGAALSIVLALATGRALVQPIVRLSEAAAAVGGGDLRVRLDEERRDEFGGLFRSFNRMTRRLRHARRALLRETRRTDAILAEASTGIVALDSAGRVRLINRRATEILELPVAVGAPLPPDGELAGRVAELVRRFRASRIAEGGQEIEARGRTVRLRMRRLGGDAAEPGGIVAALEDITDEVRTARVLAWGEMARQVAHEIKNPLTPIKLSVQHLRRAYADGRPDFGDILDRNVDAVLGEIDRLGEIARAFARFGTPPPSPGTVERVDVAAVAGETLALYRGGEGTLRYALHVDPDLPRALARGGELKEVLVNLLENARAATRGEGEVCIRVSGAGEAIVLEVTDAGEGIPAEALPRIWEPHFSTRSSGTGLGLAIVRRLVEGWGGSTAAESAPGRGTTVRIRLLAAG